MDFATNHSFIKKGPSPFIRLAVYAAFSIALLIGDSQVGLMERVRAGLSVVLYPLHWMVSLPGKLADTAHYIVTSHFDLYAQNADLKKQQLIMKSKLMRWETLEYNYQALRNLNALKARYHSSSQLAEILYTSRDRFSYKIFIDKGQDSHFHPGQPVIDNQGLIGQVTRVQPLTAEVTLIVDKTLMVPVMVQRTGVRAILYGYGGGVEVRYLPVHTDVKVGDLLTTSGIDGVYPEGLPVAKVVNVERNADNAFIRLTTIPVAGVEHGRFVMVLEEKSNLPPKPVMLDETSPIKSTAKGFVPNEE